MNKQPLPDPEKVKKTVRELKALCRQFDLLNFQLEELIAYVDAEIRKSPLTAYRLGKTPQQMIDFSEERLRQLNSPFTINPPH